MQSADVQPIHPSIPPAADTHRFDAATPTVDPAHARRRRPRGAGPRRSWRRRLAWWIPLGLLMAVALAGGGTAWRVRETFQTLNSASTAAPSLSGDVLGGDRGVVIDTGPAKTAVAAAAAGATRTPTPSPTPPAATQPSDDAPTSTATPERPERTVTTASTTAPAAKTPAATDIPAPTAAETPADADASDPAATQEPEPEPTATGVPATTTATVAAIPSTEAEIAALEPTATDVPDVELTATAVTDVELTAPLESRAIATTAPEPEATAPPAPEATATPAPDAVALSVADETPERVLSEVERIADGGFEEASAAWYVEGAGPVQVADAPGGGWVMGLPATGAYVGQSIFFIPGTTYQLTGWVRMTAEGHAGELGVLFWDEAEQRLPAAEPETVRVTWTEFRQVTMDFTPPEGTAEVGIYLNNTSGPAALQADDVSVRSVVPPAIDGGASDGPADDGTITLLFMGVDARPDEAIDIDVRPDSLMVVHLDPEAKTCRALSIPRDTRTDVEGYGLTKVNHALAVGGIDFQMQTVSNLLGIPIDHYVLIDFNGFEELVDAVGGITIDVPETFTTAGGVLFEAGPQTMDGARALAYARDRSGPEGDFGRIERQQQIIRALVARSTGLDIVTSIGDLLPAVEANVRTDLAVTDMVSIGSTYRTICAEEAVTLLRLEGELATFDDPLIKAPLSYVVVDEAEIRRKVAALLEP